MLSGWFGLFILTPICLHYIDSCMIQLSSLILFLVIVYISKRGKKIKHPKCIDIFQRQRISNKNKCLFKNSKAQTFGKTLATQLRYLNELSNFLMFVEIQIQCSCMLLLSMINGEVKIRKIRMHGNKQIFCEHITTECMNMCLMIVIRNFFNTINL